MPIPIELLYRLTDRDVALPQWGFVWRQIEVSDNATFVQSTFADFADAIPLGYLLNVTLISALANPALGKAVTSLRVDLVNRADDRLSFLITDPVPYHVIAPVVNENIAVTVYPDIVLVGAEHGMIIQATFDAAGVQALTLFFSGYLMPLGNFSRF